MKKGLENFTNKKIHDLRRRNRISETEMGEFLGLKRETYRYHELNSFFTQEEIEKAAEVFGVTVSSLISDEIDFTPPRNTTRLSDVKDSYLVLGNTLFPSDLVMKMENLSKLPQEKKKQLLDILDLLLDCKDENIETIKSYIEFLNS